MSVLPFLAVLAVTGGASAAAGSPSIHSPLPGAGLAHLVKDLIFTVGDIEGHSGQEIPIQFAVPSAFELARAGAQEGTFILVRNIPEGISLSTGMPAGKIWIVSLPGAEGLRLLSTPDTTGEFSLEFYLMGAGNRILAKKIVPVLLRQSPQRDTVAVTASPADGIDPSAPDAKAPHRPAAAAQEADPLPADEEAILLKRGEEILLQGGIAAARLLFEELATRGSGKGALALARSYDPAFTPDSRTSALSPDVEKALIWYQRAAELGSSEARKRIAEITPGR